MKLNGKHMRGITMFELVFSMFLIMCGTAIALGMQSSHMSRFSHTLNTTEHLFESSPETPLNIRVSAITAAAKMDDKRINVVQHEQNVSMNFTLDKGECENTLQRLFMADTDYTPAADYSLVINNTPYTFHNTAMGIPEALVKAICQDKNEFVKNFDMGSKPENSHNIVKK